MKKIGLIAVAGVLATAGSALAQNAADYGLDLWLAARNTTTPVPNTGAWNGTVSDAAGPIVLAPGQTVRLELRYRVTDANGFNDNFASNGLISASFAVTTGLSDAFGSFLRPGSANDFGARLTNNQRTGTAQNGTMPAFPNDSSNSAITPINFGLHAPFRTGVFPNSNGVAVPGQLAISNVLPISTAAPNHPSFDDNGNQNSNFWAVYSFQYTAPAVVGAAFVVPVTVTATGNTSLINLVNLETGAENNGFALGTAGRTFSTSLSINVTPAPGAAALLGLGGLVAARRRRA